MQSEHLLSLPGLAFWTNPEKLEFMSYCFESISARDLSLEFFRKTFFNLHHS